MNDVIRKFVSIVFDDSIDGRVSQVLLLLTGNTTAPDLEEESWDVLAGNHVGMRES